MESENKQSSSTSRKCSTIVLNISKNEYSLFIANAVLCKAIIKKSIESYPELFPEGTSGNNFQLNGSTRVSKKTGYRLKKIIIAGLHYEIRPAWLLSYQRGESKDVKWAIFLIKFGVPFWALALVFGKYAMYWYRLFVSLARNSIVGTTIKRIPTPVNLIADEEHTRTKGNKSYIATTIAKGCILGVEVAKSAGETDLKKAYNVFKQEALDLNPDYQPKTINTDGWTPLRKVLKELWVNVTLIQCILHAYIKIRDRATKKLRASFDVAKEKIWNCYNAVNKREFSQRVRRLKQWTKKSVEESPMKNNILDFCNKRDKWNLFYNHPQAYRTSNMLDRIMKQMSRFIFNNQYFHASNESATKLMRAFALLHNFAPYCPWTIKLNNKWKSPFERVNELRYANDWFENLMIATSLGGYKYNHCNTL